MIADDPGLLGWCQGGEGEVPDAARCGSVRWSVCEKGSGEVTRSKREVVERCPVGKDAIRFHCVKWGEYCAKTERSPEFPRESLSPFLVAGQSMFWGRVRSSEGCGRR